MESLRRLHPIRWLVLLAVLTSAGGVRAAGDPRDSDSPYGVLDFLVWDHEWNSHFYDTQEKMEKAVSLMKEAGIGFVRMDFLWADLEPEEGRFDFGHQDEIVDLLRQNGIQTLGILHYNVPWKNPQWNAPPDRALYVKYARAVVRHYKDRIKYWEIWNEPDSPTYWTPQDEMKTYTLLLKETYPALKEEDPTCVVLSGGLTESGSFALRRIYQNGGRGFFDIVNLHPFANPLLPNGSSILRGIHRSTLKVMEEFGDGDKPIWFTELGCPGVQDAAGKGWWHGKSPSEEEHARWVTTVYGEPLRWKGVQKIFWAFLRDTPNHFGNGVDFFGLVRTDFSKKPAFDAYRAAAASRTSSR